MGQDDYRKLISGQSKGTAAAALRAVLSIAGQIYAPFITLRNLLYSKGLIKIHQAGVPVISIGNITTGGTGKTPLVIWLANMLHEKNISTAILTRGYKETKNLKLKTKNYKDEVAILIKNCPQAKIIVNPDRAAGAAEAVNRFAAKVLIMDDGFQHRRLHRELDIVTIDATEPFGYGKLLPAGLLREPVTALKRTAAVVITRTDQITETQLKQLEEKLLSINPDMVIAKSIHAPVCVKPAADKQIGIEQLKEKKLFAFCGIGNPDAFLNTIKRLGADLVGSRIYNDHHHYTDDDIDDIYQLAQYRKADFVLTTEKDWTKIENRKSKIENQPIPFAYLAIELKITAGKDRIIRLIEDVLAGKILQK